jgi:hypothetical protein
MKDNLSRDIAALRTRLKVMEDKTLNGRLSPLVAQIVAAVGNLDVALLADGATSATSATSAEASTARKELAGTLAFKVLDILDGGSFEEAFAATLQVVNVMAIEARARGMDRENMARALHRLAMGKPT